LENRSRTIVGVSAFSIDSTVSDGRARVVAKGEIDIATADAVTRAVREQLDAGHGVVLDLSAVDFLDSTGVRALLGATNDAKARGLEFAIANPLTPQVDRGLRLMGVLSLLPLVDA
jgi:anti-anti-sigma factor